MQNIRTLDVQLIHFIRRISVPAARIALFVVFFWFGILKILGLSPAGTLVHSLFDQTIHFMSFDTFYLLFALFECLIGILFLIPDAMRFVLPLLLFHMGMTFLPLVFLPHITWQSFMVPTLEGQYIIKNLVIIACALGLASHLHPLPRK
jgi:uncharacterized membrane protein YphA (DoxX/SURF4 family)